MMAKELHYSTELIINREQKMKRFEIVDFLKGYSIFTILIFHYLQYLQLPNPFDKIIFFGGTGVHLFVFLSGFGLYYSYNKKPIKYSLFLKRRITKIYIPYIFVVLLSAILSVFIPVYHNSFYALGGHVFLYKMFDESIIGSYGYQLWFISMILQFYLTFYIIIWLKSKLKNKLFLISGFVISIGWATLVFLINKEDARIWNSFFLQYYWEFALGIIIAEKVSKNEKIISIKANQFLLLTAGLLCSSVYGFLALKGGAVGKLYNDIFAFSGYTLLAIFLYHLRLKPINQFFVFVGEISLPVYLLHILVLFTLSALINNLSSIYIVILSIIVIIPISFVYQRLITAFFKISKL